MASNKQRLQALLTDVLICSAPFFILTPIAVLWSGAGGASPLLAQAALVLGIICSGALFLLLTLFQGLSQRPTPGQRRAQLAYQANGLLLALRRALPGTALFIIILYSGWYSLALLYPAVLLLTGRSLAEWSGGSRLQSTASAAPTNPFWTRIKSLLIP
jgi:hypothetical protein